MITPIILTFLIYCRIFSIVVYLSNIAFAARSERYETAIVRKQKSSNRTAELRLEINLPVPPRELRKPRMPDAASWTELWSEELYMRSSLAIEHWISKLRTIMPVSVDWDAELFVLKVSAASFKFGQIVKIYRTLFFSFATICGETSKSLEEITRGNTIVSE